MIIIILLVLGLCFGSFVNALVWRLHEQEMVKSHKVIKSKVSKQPAKKDLSILSGRSMCVDCHHELSAKDLIPVISWLALGGKCRYCRKPISWQYPIVELLTALLFVGSYFFWPNSFDQSGALMFVSWLIFLVGFMAMAVYDIRWFILPNKLVFTVLALAIIEPVLLIMMRHGSLATLKTAFYGLLIGGGIFYVLFQLSAGKWIGGGDVKLGAGLGLIVGGPVMAFLMLFIASLLGTITALPLIVTGRAKKDTHIPFGPFLMLSTIIVYLFGASLVAWYKRQLLI